MKKLETEVIRFVKGTTPSFSGNSGGGIILTSEDIDTVFLHSLFSGFVIKNLDEFGIEEGVCRPADIQEDSISGEKCELRISGSKICLLSLYPKNNNRYWMFDLNDYVAITKSKEKLISLAGDCIRSDFGDYVASQIKDGDINDSEFSKRDFVLVLK